MMVLRLIRSSQHHPYNTFITNLQASRKPRHPQNHMATSSSAADRSLTPAAPGSKRLAFSREAGAQDSEDEGEGEGWWGGRGVQATKLGVGPQLPVRGPQGLKAALQSPLHARRCCVRTSQPGPVLLAPWLPGPCGLGLWLCQSWVCVRGSHHSGLPCARSSFGAYPLCCAQ
jgi:hypothetical protein